ncbi:hypothetical protein AcW1_003994 [Taiwanofungus camphoratus]|nr:hypothetical protein AcV7_007714 [Antrodia cinnamomea]KAI0959053.1 hypothetical protein AcW1_003994 [Antrodia cinnamomea]
MLQYHDFLKDIKLNGCKLDLRGSLLLDLEGTHASASFFVSLQHAPHHPFVFLACLNDTCENPILILSRLPEASVSKHSSYTYLGLLLFKCFTTAISETPAVSV